jgi:lipopolysaccharide biosynthesis glycosyltransferase
MADASGRLDEETIVLVAGADDRFALGLTVALSSALKHLDSSRRAHVFVLDGGISPAGLERCRGCLLAVRPDVEITVVENDPERFAAFNFHLYSRAAYLRLLIPEVVPARYARALYLDSDLVVQGDIAELWALPDEGKPFWAAFDEGVRGTDYVKETLFFADVPAGTPYFNSGVLLIDLPRWREQRISETAVAVLAEHSGHCINVDQDALNVVAIDKWSVLPPAWNTQVVGREAWRHPSGQSPRIIHFINHKPWLRNVDCLYQREFNVALRASGWFSPVAYQAHVWDRRTRLFLSKTRERARNASALQPILEVRRRWRRARRARLESNG